MVIAKGSTVLPIILCSLILFRVFLFFTRDFLQGVKCSKLSFYEHLTLYMKIRKSKRKSHYMGKKARTSAIIMVT